MPKLPQSKLLAACFAVAALLVLPAAANATLTYTKGFAKPRVYFAEDNGKGARQIGLGRDSHASPNGELVVFERENRGKGTDEMKLYSVATGKITTLLGNWRENYVFAWSPDSTTVAALSGPLNGASTLIVINVETGKQRTVQKGYFNGVSFSPESTEIVYGVSKGIEYPPESNLYKWAIGGGSPVALSHNFTSVSPLWGPTGQIAFGRQLGAKQRQYGPKNDLFVMNENGERISRLTEFPIDALAQGLAPIAWSENGNRLLAEFGGQDQEYAVAVNTVTGSAKALTKNTESGFLGAAITPDGKTVLGTTGLGFGGHPHPQVVTVPFTGGKEKVLVNGGFEPSWGG